MVATTGCLVQAQERVALRRGRPWVWERQDSASIVYAVVVNRCRNLLVLVSALLARPLAAGSWLRANEAKAVRTVAALAADREEVGGACSEEAGAEATAVRLAAAALAADRKAAGCGA